MKYIVAAVGAERHAVGITAKALGLGAGGPLPVDHPEFARCGDNEFS
jgi:hypothetical protein